MDMNAVIG